MPNLPDNESLLPLPEIIRRAKDRGYIFGFADPYNRLRYYIKIGLLPNMVRRSPASSTSGQIPPTGHLPAAVVDQLLTIQEKIRQGYSTEDLVQQTLRPVPLSGTNSGQATEPTALTAGKQEPISAAEFGVPHWWQGIHLRSQMDRLQGELSEVKTDIQALGTRQSAIDKQAAETVKLPVEIPVEETSLEVEEPGPLYRAVESDLAKIHRVSRVAAIVLTTLIATVGLAVAGGVWGVAPNLSDISRIGSGFNLSQILGLKKEITSPLSSISGQKLARIERPAAAETTRVLAARTTPSILEINSDVGVNGSFTLVGAASISQNLVVSGAGATALNLTGNSSSITFAGTGANQIITAGTNNLILSPGGNVGIGQASPSYKLDVSGNTNLSTGSTYKIGGTDVLSSSTLGSGVTNSSLTKVGALDSGSITSGFGKIDNGADDIITTGNIGSAGNSIFTGKNLILSGTTSLNSIIYTWPSSQTTDYVLTTNGSGTLSWTSISGAGAITGSGTANYLARWSSGSVLTSSLLYDNGTILGTTANLGAGTTNPLNKLDVSGSAAIGSPPSISLPQSNMLYVSGNVGVNQTAPSQKLVVAGNAFLGGNSQNVTSTFFAAPTTVDASGRVGRFNAIALDSSGNPHISYFDDDNTALKYASYNGSSWSTETVTATDSRGWFTSLAIDTNDRPHISFLEEDNDDLYYAFYNGSSWTITLVDGSSANISYFNSIALNSSNQPRICYFYDPTGGDLKYASYNGTSWTTETVDSTGITGYGCSLALEPSTGNPRIAYIDQTNGRLRYASYNGSSWSTETIDTSVGAYSSTSLKMSSSGRPRIAYWEATNNDIKYTVNDTGSWSTTTVDATDDLRTVSLALDGNGNPRIAYYDATNKALKYASFDGSTWSKRTLDGLDLSGWHSNLVLDANNNPHLSYYYDPDNGSFDYDLKYISGSTFSVSGNDLFAADKVGIKGNILSDGSLAIGGSLYADGDFYLNNGGGDSSSYLYFASQAGDTGKYLGWNSNFEEFSLSDNLAVPNSSYVGIGSSSPRVVFNSSYGLGLIQGNVGIGSSNPSQALDIAGDRANLTFSGTTGAHQIQTGGTTNLALIPGGNVGVGTTAPAALLSVGTSAQFRVDSSGNVTRVNNVAYSFPSSQGATNTVLTNDSAGNLTWSSISGAGGVSGTGNANFLPRWTSTSVIGNSLIFDNGSIVGTNANLGIGNTSPSSTLSVGGSSQFRVDSSGNITRINDIAYSFPSVQGGVNSSLINDGSGSLTWVSSSGSGGIGYWNRLGTTLMPVNAGDAIATTGNVGVGTTTPRDALNVSGSAAIGSLLSVSLPQSNMLYVSGNVGIGTTGPGAVLDVAGRAIVASGTRNLFISGGNTTLTGADNIAIGTSALAGVTTSRQNVAVGNYAGQAITTSSYDNNVFVGYNAGNVTVSERNVMLGAYAGANNVSGGSNTYVGYLAGRGAASNTSIANTALGYQAASAVTTADEGVFIGFAAGQTVTSGDSNIIIGSYADVSNGTYAKTTIVGYTGSALGSNAVTLGYFARAGASSVAIGPNTRADADNTLAIDNSTTTAPLIWGDFSTNTLGVNGNVGIGTTAPSTQLSVGASSQFRVDSSGNLTRVNNVAYSWPSAQGAVSSTLVNDGVGNLSWSSGSGGGGIGYWNRITAGNYLIPINPGDIIATTGNVGVGTTASLNTLDVSGKAAIGSIPSVTLPQSNMLYVSGNVGVGTTLPTSALHVAGAGNITNGLTIANGLTVSSGDASFKTVSINPGSSSTSLDVRNINGGLPAVIYRSNASGIGEILQLKTTLDTPGITGGGSVGFYNNTSTNDIQLMSSITSVWSEATHATRTGDIYFSTVNQGTTAEKLRITGAGNVGIGTTNPRSFLLQVAGNVGPDADDNYDLGSNALRFRDLYLGPASIHLGTSTSDEYTIAYNTSQNFLGFNVNGSGNDDIIFDSNGNVGIGTTAPAYKLDVAGNLRFTGTTTLNGIAYTWPSAQTNNYVLTTDGAGTLSWTSVGGAGAVTGTGNPNFLAKFSTGTSTLGNSLIFDNGTILGTTANTGIGTTDPKNKLDVSGSVAIGSLPNSPLPASNTNMLYVSGNVGLGTTNPLATLSIGSSSQFRVDSSGNLTRVNNIAYSFPASQGAASTVLTNDSAGTLSWSSISGAGGVTGTGNPNFIPRWTSTTALGNSLIFDNSTILGTTANTGIGTTDPKNKLDVSGSVAFGSLPTQVLPQSNSAYFSGNVGIGTTNPSQALDVNGTIRLTGFSLPTGASNLYVLTSDGSGTGTWMANQSQVSGNPNFLAKFTTATNTLGSSLIFDNGTIVGTTANVGIGNTNPSSFKLQVTGDIGPSSNNAYNLGSSSLSFANAYVTNLYGGTSGAQGYWNRITTGSYLIPLTAGDIIATTGNVGVGTTSSLNTLDVNGKAAIGSIPSVTLPQSNMLYVSGNVGLGTTSPRNSLDVSGAAAIGSYAGVNAAPTNGLIVSGNVGIGTDSPGSMLQVANNSTAGTLRVGGTTSYWELYGTDNGGLSGAYLMYNRANPNNGIRFGGSSSSQASNLGVRLGWFATSATPGFTALTTNNTDRLTVDGSGNVGIGVASPLSLLDVSGDALIRGNLGIGTTAPAQALDIEAAVANLTFSNAVGNHQIITGGTTNLALMPGRNVGIGTTNPLGKLHVFGNVGIGVTAPLDQLDVTGSVAFGALPTQKLPQANSAYFSGNVGIGTTNPTDKLEVNGGITLDGSGSGNNIRLYANGSTDALWRNTTANTATYVRVSPNGSTGAIIPATIQVFETDWGASTTNFSAAEIRYDPVSTAFQINTNAGGSNSLRPIAITSGTTVSSGIYINTSGNVGIGYINPGTAKLAVNGNIGIGVTNVYNKLDVSGSVAFGSLPTAALPQANSAYFSGNVGIGATSPGGKLHVFGNVGVGVTSPLDQLDVTGSVAFGALPTTALPQANMAYFSGNVGIGTTNPQGIFQVGTQGTPPLFVSASNGNVGIGTTVVGAKLYVASSPTAENLFGQIIDMGTVPNTITTNTALQTNISLTGFDGRINTSQINTGYIYSTGNYDIYNNGIRSTSTIHATNSTYSDAAMGFYGIAQNDAASAQTIGDSTFAHNEHVVGVRGEVDGAWNENTSMNSGAQYWLAGVYGESNTTGTAKNYGGYFRSIGSSTGTNIGVYASASGGSSNYAAIFDQGDVGIGSTRPKNQLDVAGSVAFGTLPTLALPQSNSAYFSGNVGVGATSPGGKLHVFGNVGVGVTSPLDQLDVTGSVAFGALPTQKLPQANMLYVSGNVGIGTTAPAYNLDVAGDIQVQGSTPITYPIKLLTTQSAGTFGTSSLIVRASGANASYPATTLILESGDATQTNRSVNLQLGTSANGSTMQAQVAATPLSLFIDHQGGGAGANTEGIKFRTTGSFSQRMIIADNGNVGIGTTGPAYTLDVAGTLNVTGAVSCGSGCSAGPWQRTSPVTYLANANDALSLDSTVTSLPQTKSLYVAGNVGIGTTAPGSLLEVNQNANSTTPIVRVVNDNTGTAAGSVISIGENIASNKMLQVSYLNSGFTPNGQNRPNMGIINVPAGGTGGLGIRTAAAAPITFATNGVSNERMIIDAGGNVGIGTTLPTTILNLSTGTGVANIIRQDFSDTSKYAEILAYQGNGSLVGGINFIGSAFGSDANRQNNLEVVSSTSTGDITLWTNNLERARVDAGGNVGIGTTAPAQLLELSGSFTGNSRVMEKLTNTDTSTTSFSAIQLFSGADTSKLSLNKYGSEYIATAGYSNYGAIATDSSSGLLITASNSTGTLQFLTGNSLLSNIRMTVDSGGNVGIGTTAPSAPLEVKGSGTGAVIAKFTDNNTTGCTLATGGTISCSSDLSLKKNINILPYGISDLMNLRPVEYNWKTEADGTTKSLGFVAQEVEQFIPKLVLTDGNTGLKELNTIGLVPVLTKAVQEQQNEIRTLKSFVGIGTSSPFSTINNLQLTIDSPPSLSQRIEQAQSQIAQIDQKLGITSDKLEVISNKEASGSAQLTTLEENVASLSAQVGEGRSMVERLVQKISDLEGLILGGTRQPASDSAQVASESANLLNPNWSNGSNLANVDGNIEIDPNIIAYKDLNVLGKTTTNDLYVLGKVNVGFLTIDGLNNSIDSLGSDLKLQSSPLAGNVDAFNGKVVIAKSGDLVVEGIVVAKQVKTDELTVGKVRVATESGQVFDFAATEILGQASRSVQPVTSNATIGDAVIPPGQTFLTVNNNQVTKASKIFITAETAIDQTIAVTDKNAGSGFKVQIKRPELQEVKFSWWIVN